MKTQLKEIKSEFVGSKFRPNKVLSSMEESPKWIRKIGTAIVTLSAGLSPVLIELGLPQVAAITAGAGVVAKVILSLFKK